MEIFSGVIQRGFTVGILLLYIGTTFDQEAGHSWLAGRCGKMQGGLAFTISELDVGAVLKECLDGLPTARDNGC